MLIPSFWSPGNLTLLNWMGRVHASKHIDKEMICKNHDTQLQDSTQNSALRLELIRGELGEVECWVVEQSDRLAAKIN